MGIEVVELHDPADAAERAHDFLVAQPVRHNLLLTILYDAIRFSTGGTFWLASDGPEIVGFGLESPPGMGAVLAPMAPETCRAVAAAITIPLTRVQSETATAAAFAGAWAERHHVAGVDLDGGRFYELGAVHSVASAPGEIRLAEASDRATLVEWSMAFAGETETGADHAGAAVDLAMARRLLWVWDDGGPVSMSGASRPHTGVSRIQRVYTPPEHRGHGYATACVEHQSRLLVERGLGCVLYTQLSNPTSNAIYRRIGYRPIAEILAVRFA
jgi:ribosomal protein S18 acetylase RimI-like enzyme